MKIHTTEQLLDAIDEDLAWRKKELATVNFAIDRSKTRPRLLNTALRAGITLLYAHWEGFLKASSEFYIEFVSRQAMPNQQLADNFLALAARKPIHDLAASPKVAQAMAVIDFFRRKMADTATLPHKSAVNTQSNLSSDVLKDISSVVGVHYSHFETKSALIDERLVHKRNHIAHGQFLDVDAEDFAAVFAEVTAMMETWRNEIQNACVTKRYTNTTP